MCLGKGGIPALDTEVPSREVCPVGAATAEEPGHLYSEETCKAEGLLSAVARAGEALGEPAKTVFCGPTGENIAIKSGDHGSKAHDFP